MSREYFLFDRCKNELTDCSIFLQNTLLFSYVDYKKFLGMSLTVPPGLRPAKTATQLHIRLQARFRQAIGMLPLPEGTLMDSTGLFPVLPLTRSSSSDVNFVGTLKRPAPTQEADTRPTSPKRPKHC